VELSGLWILVIGTVAAALIFDVINGFHDAANSIATVVSTRVLSPRTAVLWAAFFNFVAMFVFAPKVADTISKIVYIRQGDPVYVEVVLAGLVGAIAWDLLTWWWSLPTSSSHALIGGFAGAGFAFKGWGAVHWDKLFTVMAFIPIAPLIGFIFGFGFMVAVYWIFREWRPMMIDRFFRKGQLLSASLYSLGHGGNDAQKTMGIKVTKLQPVGGFCAETSGAVTLFMATFLGIPVSTTHTIAGGIIGVGATRRLTGIKWDIAFRIIMAWIVTIPCSAVIAALTFYAIAALR
jgi:PiT family inorganic phosphate transporter